MYFVLRQVFFLTPSPPVCPLKPFGRKRFAVNQSSPIWQEGRGRRKTVCCIQKSRTPVPATLTNHTKNQPTRTKMTDMGERGKRTRS